MSVLDIRKISDTSSNSQENNGTKRPPLARRDTDAILSYYQSEASGQSYTSNTTDFDNHPASTIQRSFSSASDSSSSNYSKDHSEPSTEPTSDSRDESAFHFSYDAQPVPGHRSPHVLDRRRLATFEVDSTNSFESPSKVKETFYPEVAQAVYSSTLLAKRGIDESRMTGIVIATASDLQNTYRNSPPPISAPPVSRRDPFSPTQYSSSAGVPARHQRSASENPKQVGPPMSRKASRDVGIVGTGAFVAGPDGAKSISRKPSINQADQVSPIFQTPHPGPHTPIPSPHPSRPSSPSGKDRERISKTAANEVYRLEQSKPHSPFNGRHQKVVNGNTEAPKPLSIGTKPVSSSHTSTGGNTTSPATGSGYSETPNLNPPGTPYLYYEPGTHATAGPLPPPPRQIIPPSFTSPPPPRPPRLQSPSPSSRSYSLNTAQPITYLRSSPSKSHSSLTPEVNSSGASQPEHGVNGKMLSPSPSDSDSLKSESMQTVHVREGAFPAASVFAAQPRTASNVSINQDRASSNRTMQDLVAFVGEAIEEVGSHNEDEVLPPSILEPAQEHSDGIQERRSALDLKRPASWSSSIKAKLLDETDRDSLGSFQGSSTQSATHLMPFSHDTVSETLHSSTPESRRTPSPQKQSLDYSLKRLASLPRTPSLLSKRRFSYRSASSKAPSPPPHPPVIVKIRSAWPDAMSFRDVLVKKGALERALGYARKINELGAYDCGLGDWVVGMKRKNHPRESRISIDASTPTAPSERSVNTQARHTSHGSVNSEATFPRRPDAYVATDLAWRPSEDESAPNAPPPSLPYPALAQGGVRVPPARTFGVLSPRLSTRTAPSTPINKSSGGFFASIGRKASIKREKTILNTPPTAKLLRSRSPPPPTPPRPVNITTIPTIPGGPRAPPSRPQRPQSIAGPSSRTTHSSFVTKDMISMPRLQDDLSPTRASVNRRPSLFAGTQQAVPEEAIPNFEQQVSKLAALIPHADKAVLARYLSRAGQDYLAIGQYLEDERNGTIRLD
ncbi:hypothetical protein BD410DRAFT_892746 [Rickenella mellea]|uniref:Uncharacterized protein n=1 Tax=Rickenella mellea TaxID=50990 RepID=A0A4R5XFS5_9AGAM|nr:hypothetical protein BD410DRAFT_892746 [Rickenella mellea]